MSDADRITRLNAALEGRYRIERELGAGGMATVYLAEDLRHRRNVALKVLRPELAAVVGSERFLAEIETTASLQHPHILPLFDSGEADGFLFYVMPYVEGESLRDRLDRKHQLPLDEAVRIASDVANALDYAHGHGVIHRDIKPANILLNETGEPLVSDFGIALAVSAGGGGRLTETGLSLGTPHYMSPEQASGDLKVGPATDIYALGCVLYQMLLGEPPFTGSTPQAVLGKILTGDPELPSAVRGSVPPHVDGAVRKALERIPADRFTSARTFADALQDPGFRYGRTGATTDRASGRSLARERLAWIGALVAVALVASSSWLTSPPAREVVRHPVSVPLSDLPGSTTQRFALSPSGDRLAYIAPSAEGPNQLWHREVDVLEPTLVAASGSVEGLAFSPDGSRIAFSDDQRGLFIVSIMGETPVKIAELPVGGGGSPFLDWGPDDRIYAEGPDGIMATRPSGTPSWEPVTRRGPGEARHVLPHVLPDGRGLLFVIRRMGGGGSSSIGVADFATGEHVALIPGVRAVFSRTGHVVYATSQGVLSALAFDEARLEARGDPQVLVGGVRIGQFGLRAEIAIAGSGTLLYVSDEIEEDLAQLVWVNRDGSEVPVDPTWVEAFRTVALMPGERRLAVSIASRGEEHVWVRSIDGGVPQRLSLEGNRNWRPSWRPDGRLVAYVSNRSGALRAFARPGDLSAPESELLPSADGVEEVEWLPDGESVVVRRGGGISGGTRDLLVGTVGESELQPLVATGSNERTPSLSPDGEWLVYLSDESVIVRSFPAGDVSWSLASDGGGEALWSPAGDEIFYRDQDLGMVAVRVETEPTFSVLDRRVIFDSTPYRLESNHRAFDVTEDGERFLMIRTEEGGGRLIWVQNFTEELRAQVPG